MISASSTHRDARITGAESRDPYESFMHIWYGIKGTVDKKLSVGLEELKKQGYPFSYKIFPDMGHGGLIGENTERFIEEVEAVHNLSFEKRENKQ